MDDHTQKTRQDVLAIMRRIYGPGVDTSEAELALPDPVDIDRDAAILARFGLTPSQLANAIGEAP